MNKAHVETLVSKIEDFEKVDEDPTAKRIVMRNSKCSYTSTIMRV